MDSTSSIIFNGSSRTGSTTSDRRFVVHEKQIEGLADLVRRVRAEKGFSLTDVERNARRAGFEIAGSYVNRIENEVADADGLTVKKLQALAAGLEFSEEVLFAVARGKSPTDPDVEHAEIAEMYDDIPPQCQKDVRDLLVVLRRNHSVSAGKKQREQRRHAAAAASGIREVGQLSSPEDRNKGKRPVEAEPDEGEEVTQATSPELADEAERDRSDERESPPERRRANGK